MSEKLRPRCARPGCKRRVVYLGAEHCSHACYAAELAERELEARGDAPPPARADQLRLPW